MTVCERGCWHASAADGFGVGSCAFRSCVSRKAEKSKVEINSKFFN
jgi:hypothetical protein